MSNLAGRRAIFVTYASHVSDRPGGVQTCSREYLALFQAMGFDVEVLKVDLDRRLGIRLRRRLSGSPYVGPIGLKDISRVKAAAEAADLVLLNQVALSGAWIEHPSLRQLANKTVLLSHGAEVTDLLHQVRSPTLGDAPRRANLADVRRVLSDEIAARAHVSAALCLSPFDADFERWLGTPRVTWVPRTVRALPLDWKPVANRFGFLGTLDHVPNTQGLLDLLRATRATANTDLRIRVVGGPRSVGTWLAANHPIVDYLGPLTDPELVAEAATWSAFLNPIFCQARGCSTKLATALGWEIPIVTTSVGARGYVQRDGAFATAEDPKTFADLLQNVTAADGWAEVRARTVRVARSTPTIEEHARTVEAALKTRHECGRKIPPSESIMRHGASIK